MEKIILASNSPRRKALLSQLGMPFEIIVSGIDEEAEEINYPSPYDLVKALSEKKARDVAGKVTGNACIIGADTVVSLAGKIIGKPADERDAFNILKTLQGKPHMVYTGVTLIRKDGGNESVKHIVDNAVGVMVRGIPPFPAWLRETKHFNSLCYVSQNFGSRSTTSS